MHAVHKMLAAAAGKERVSPGEIINARVDVAGINDIYLLVVNSFNDMLGSKVWDPAKVYIFMDHNAPASTLKAAENQKAFREFADKYGCNIVEINEGICHMVLPESGAIRPGAIVIITDSHTTTHGALGAFGTGVGSTDMAAILMEGAMWLRVPDVVNVRLSGRLADGVMAKDAALYILGKLGTSFANYKVIEFSGPVIEALPVEERMVLCNMAVEMGAKATFIKPDQTTVDYVTARTAVPFTVYESDPDYQYAAEYDLELSALEPQVAVPFAVNNARNLTEVEGTAIDQVFVGSCTGGKNLDIEVVAKVLKGRKIAPTTRLVVTMASKKVLQEALEKGYVQILLEAGAAITTPGCGGCSGLLGGILAAHETCASTANRNFVGRMGSEQSKIYLVSPLTAAATALTGRLTHPSRL
ncbi:MAG: aconitase/3-isopropylmalate dehydratase large subunit family protein [Negativicutes bacterium]|nr:aconitase/3-isopropylmalate dehydratase large subunit family protein [Negativicutes bacterium]